MTRDYDDTQSISYQAQRLGSIGDPINRPDPADWTRYRADQEASRKEQEDHWAAERAAEDARRQADRDIQRLAAALEAALRTNAHGASARQVVSDAREFEAFLKGEAAQ